MENYSLSDSQINYLNDLIKITNSLKKLYIFLADLEAKEKKIVLNMKFYQNIYLLI